MSALLALGILYFALIVQTLKRYSSHGDKAQSRRRRFGGGGPGRSRRRSERDERQAASERDRERERERDADGARPFGFVDVEEVEK